MPGTLGEGVPSAVMIRSICDYKRRGYYVENEIIAIQETKKCREHGIGRTLHKDTEIIQNSPGGSCNE